MARNEQQAHWPRAILHVDMDAFFASVEQLDNPDLHGKPVIVGGSLDGRGVVAAASYEARAFGVHSAMPTARAYRLCPRGVFLPGRMERYGEVSKVIHAIFARFTPLVRPLSVDEAFLDVTGCQRLFGPPAAIGRRLKETIRAETGLTASVGAAPTLFVAKVASDLEKPDGLVLIREEEVLDRLAPLPIRRIWGVGPKLAERLERLGVHTVEQLRAWPLDALVAKYGEMGGQLWRLARGIDPREIHDQGREPEKSISNETTFAKDILDRAQLERILLRLADKVASRAREAGYRGRVVQLKLRYDDFGTVTRRVSLPTPTHLAREIHAAALRLLRERTEAGRRPARLIGVGIAHLVTAGPTQGGLFSATDTSIDEAELQRTEALERATDEIRARLGRSAIGRASLLLQPDPRKPGPPLHQNAPRSDPRTDSP